MSILKFKNPETGAWEKVGIPSQEITPESIGAATVAQVEAAQSSADSKVPTTRKINNKQLNADITLTANDVGAASKSLSNVSNEDMLAKIEASGFSSGLQAYYGSFTTTTGQSSYHNFEVQHDIGKIPVLVLFSHNDGAIYIADRNGSCSNRDIGNILQFKGITYTENKMSIEGRCPGSSVEGQTYTYNYTILA